jgi:hypothetical protein
MNCKFPGKFFSFMVVFFVKRLGKWSGFNYAQPDINNK